GRTRLDRARGDHDETRDDGEAGDLKRISWIITGLQSPIGLIVSVYVRPWLSPPTKTPAAPPTFASNFAARTSMNSSSATPSTSAGAASSFAHASRSRSAAVS